MEFGRKIRNLIIFQEFYVWTIGNGRGDFLLIFREKENFQISGLTSRCQGKIWTVWHVFSDEKSMYESYGLY